MTEIEELRVLVHALEARIAALEARLALFPMAPLDVYPAPGLPNPGWPYPPPIVTLTGTDGAIPVPQAGPIMVKEPEPSFPRPDYIVGFDEGAKEGDRAAVSIRRGAHVYGWIAARRDELVKTEEVVTPGTRWTEPR